MYISRERVTSYEAIQPFLSYNLINSSGSQCWLAGGAIRSAIGREPIADYDLFFRNSIAAANTRITLEDRGFEIVFKCPEGKLTTYKKGDMKIQCITENYYNSMQSLIDTFDITACRYVMSDDRVLTSYSAIRDTLKKRINLHRIDNPVATMKRIAKYVSKGYTLTTAASEKFVDSIYEKGVERMELNRRVYID
jgi:hypothetical protein